MHPRVRTVRTSSGIKLRIHQAGKLGVVTTHSVTQFVIGASVVLGLSYSVVEILLGLFAGCRSQYGAGARLKRWLGGSDEMDLELYSNGLKED